MKYVHFPALFLLLAAAYSGVCRGETAAPPKPEGALRVGVILPLSGDFATWGERIRQGLTLAAEDTTHRFTLEYADESGCDTKLSMTNATKLLAQKVRVFFMGCLGGTKAVAPVAARQGALIFSAGLLDQQVLRQDLPLINLTTQLATEARYLAVAVAKRGMRKAAILRSPDAFGEELARWLKLELDKREVKVVFDDATAPAGNDYRTTIVRLRQHRPDALIVQLGDSQLAVFMRQLRESGISIPVFSNYVIEANSSPSAAFEGIVYTYPVNSAEGSAVKQAFDRRFTERFGAGTQPSANTYFAYDGLRLLDEAVSVCGSIDAKCIFSTITGAPRKGISGDLVFNADGSIMRPYGIKKIEHGAFVWLSKEIVP